MDGFDKFWYSWPRSTRKGGKSTCLAKWKKGYYETCADQILKHVAWMKTTDDWRKQNGAFIPAPLVYLNQQRWDGAEVPETRQELSPMASVVDQRAVWAAEDAKASKPSPEVAARLAQLRGLRNQ